MKAVQLTRLNGLDSLKVVEVDRPKPQAHELPIKVEAAGINFAELEMTKGSDVGRARLQILDHFGFFFTGLFRKRKASPRL